MKKYLFLLLLFIIYLILLQLSDEDEVISYDELNTGSAVNVLVSFENGINSNNLSTLFNNYNKEYYVYALKVNDDKINLSCDLIDDCINEVYDEENNLFYLKYLTSGFKVDEIEFIAYKDEVLPFLNKNNLAYKIN